MEKVPTHGLDVYFFNNRGIRRWSLGISRWIGLAGILSSPAAGWVASSHRQRD